MRKVDGKPLQRVRITLAPPLVLLVLAIAACSQEASDQQPARTVEPPAKRGQPLDVYRSYLNAIKKNDLAEAKACWWLPGEDMAALDVLAGMWVSFRAARFWPWTSSNTAASVTTSLLYLRLTSNGA